MKAVVAAFNQEKAPVGVGAFSVIVQLHRLIVYSTSYDQLYPSASLTDCESDAQPRQAAEVDHSVLRPGHGSGISRTGVCMITARVRSSAFPHLSLLVSITYRVLTFTSYWLFFSKILFNFAVTVDCHQDWFYTICKTIVNVFSNFSKYCWFPP